MTVRKRYVIRILWNLLPFVQLNPHCFDLDLAGEELPLPVGVPATRRHRLVIGGAAIEKLHLEGVLAEVFMGKTALYGR